MPRPSARTPRQTILFLADTQGANIVGCHRPELALGNPHISRLAAERFGGGEVTFVGDRGMIKGGQIEELSRHGMRYLTAITKPRAVFGTGRFPKKVSILSRKRKAICDIFIRQAYWWCGFDDDLFPPILPTCACLSTPKVSPFFSSFPLLNGGQACRYGLSEKSPINYWGMSCTETP